MQNQGMGTASLRRLSMNKEIKNRAKKTKAGAFQSKIMSRLSRTKNRAASGYAYRLVQLIVLVVGVIHSNAVAVSFFRMNSGKVVVVLRHGP